MNKVVLCGFQDHSVKGNGAANRLQKAGTGDTLYWDSTQLSLVHHLEPRHRNVTKHLAKSQCFRTFESPESLTLTSPNTIERQTYSLVRRNKRQSELKHSTANYYWGLCLLLLLAMIHFWSCVVELYGPWVSQFNINRVINPWPDCHCNKMLLVNQAA